MSHLASFPANGLEMLCGIEEEARLFEGIPVDVYAMPEGSVHH